MRAGNGSVLVRRVFVARHRTLGGRRWEQYAEHVVEEHARSVDAPVPDGKVQVKLREDGMWVTATPEEARELHEVLHRE